MTRNVVTTPDPLSAFKEVLGARMGGGGGGGGGGFAVEIWGPWNEMWVLHGNESSEPAQEPN